MTEIRINLTPREHKTLKIRKRKVTWKELLLLVGNGLTSKQEDLILSRRDE